MEKNNKYNKRGTANDVMEKLRSFSEEEKRLAKERRIAVFHCDHKLDNGQPDVVSVERDERGKARKVRCQKCQTLIDQKVLTLAEVRERINAFNAVIEQIKLMSDTEYVPILAKIEEGADSIEDAYNVIVLKSGNKKNKKKGSNNNKYQRKASYKVSKL